LALCSYTNTNGYPSNVKILYKSLWREVKFTQKCGLHQSKEWIFIFNLLFLRFFFIELFNIEKKIVFASTFNSSVKKIIQRSIKKQIKGKKIHSFESCKLNYAIFNSRCATSQSKKFWNLMYLHLCLCNFMKYQWFFEVL